MVAVGRRDGHRQALAVGHIGGTLRSDATALASRRSDGVAVLGEGRREGMVGLYVGERPAVLCNLLLSVNGQIINVPALVRRDGVALAVAAQHLAGAGRTDTAAFASRDRDGVAVAHEGRHQGMVGGDATEGVFSDGTAIHTVHEHRVDMVTVGRRDGHRQALSVGHVGSARRGNATALASRRSDGVAVLGEGRRDGVVSLYVGERPAVLCSLLFAVNGKIVNVPAFIGRNGAVPIVAAKHLAGAARTDATALASRGCDGVAVAHEGRRQGMVGGDAAEGVFRNAAAVHTVHQHRVDMVAVGRRDGHRQALAVGHIGGASRRNATALAGRRSDGVAVLGEGSRNGVVGLYVGERPAVLCNLLHAVNGQEINVPAFIGRNGAVPIVAAKHLAGAARTDASALAGRSHDGVAVAHEGRRQSMVGGDVVEGVFGNGSAKHTIHKHRVDMVAVGRCDGHRQALAVGHVGGACRRNATALTGRRSDGVAVLGEGDRDGVVATHIAKGPAVLRSLLLAINSQIVNIPAFIRRDGAVPVVAAQYICRAARTDATTLASRSRDGVAVAHEGRRYGMIFNNITEKIIADSA